MQGGNTADWLQAVSSILTMFAAFIAAVVAWRAPTAAAKFAEKLRQQSADDEDMRRFRMTVFSALMKCRREILNVDARAAINLADVAFADVAEVRVAQKLFFEATQALPPSPERIIERYYNLIEAVARAMDFGPAITGFDVRAGYYPEALGKLDDAAFAEAEEKLARRAAAVQATNASHG